MMTSTLETADLPSPSETKNSQIPSPSIAHRLRITQQTERAGHYRIMLELEDQNVLLRGEAIVEYARTPVQQETMRWYFEDFLKHPLEPAPRIAEQVEEELDKIGFELFSAVFDSNDDVREIWRRARDCWDSIRVEIATSDNESALTPWELMREERGGVPLALRAQSFVRTINAPPQTIYPLSSNFRPLRILLVICRPKAKAEVPFRSVALRIIGSLSGHADIQLDVLRPPTFAALQERLEQASNDDNPYQIVHFDGHGTYEDPKAKFEDRTRLVLRGYLLFEGGDERRLHQPVDGTLLGQTLAKTRVPLLVLNACRSAFAEPLPMPSATPSVDRERCYSSLAQEVMAAGVVGVVAMRYNIRVDTAAEFAAQLYAALANRVTLGEAVTRSRTYLAQASLRNTGYETRSLQDWFTPLVYETTPLNLMPPRTPPIIADRQALREMVNFPARPKAGYVGGDDTLLAIERAVQSVSLVLIHGPAGSGKTATATEFAAWYVRTQGVNKPAIFTSFEGVTQFDQVLEVLGQMFESAMDLQGVRWAELDRAARRRKAVKLLRERPVLWVWDSVEGVDGFPPGTESHWSEAERQELWAFLRDVNGGRSKIILTSRREESNWLGKLPLRISISGLRLDDFMPLATALTHFHAQPRRSVVAWWPILRISRGNPLMGTVLIEQVLRNGLKDADEIATFATTVQSGDAVLEFAGTDRPQSLRTSLDYGWITDQPREGWKILALLHLFQGWVNVITLCAMGYTDQPWSLPTVRDLSTEQAVGLLNQAADAGLLIRVPKEDGLYIAHPALAWFLKPWFEDAYPAHSQDELEGDEAIHQMAIRAFTCAVGELGEALHRQYARGESDGSHLLAEQANFIRAWNLAFTHDWWGALVKIMQGLRSLYRHTGRQQDWAQLVEKASPLLCDATTGGSLPEREESWFVFSEYAVEISIRAQRWDQAESLQRLRLEWASRAAEAALTAPSGTLDDNQRSLIRDLAGVYSRLGFILDGQGVAACITEFEKAIRLFQLIGDRSAEAGVADRLGVHYLRTRELDEAEHWYTYSGCLRDESDWLGKSRVEARKGNIELQRLDQAQKEGRPEEEQSTIYQKATKSFAEALKWLEYLLVGDVELRAEIHAQFGSLHRIAGRPDLALPQYTEALALYEELGRLLQATEARFNIAVTLADQKRFGEALEYAQLLLGILEQQGFAPASQEMQSTHELCGWLESQKGANQ